MSVFACSYGQAYPTHVTHLCLCFSAWLVHSIVYAGKQGLTAGYQHRAEIHWSRSWSALKPYPGSPTVESHETKLYPGLASHTASPSPPGSQSLTVSVCISAQQILTKEVTDLPHSLILYHIHVWPNGPRVSHTHSCESLKGRSAYLKKWSIRRCSFACFNSEPAIATKYKKCERYTYLY